MIPIQVWALPVLLSAPALVQVDDSAIVVMRVTSTEPRSAFVDRGSIDGLAVHDRVVFRPREGGHFEGTVVRLDERTAVVELDDPAYVPAPGTRAEVRVPNARFAAPPKPEGAANAPANPAPTEPEHPPWQNPDEHWSTDQPLLSRVRPLRPSERDPRLSGRFYSFVDYASNTEGKRSDTFARVGTDLLYENAFRKGGDFHFDGELNYRNTDVPDDDDQRTTRFRLDRASYSFGGDRFAPDRVELGRFLQHGMPEFGVLDGIEWGRRTRGGDSWGTSVGFMPEPTPEQSTGDDLQFAAFYRYVVDESELLSLEAGYQKSFHDLAADRDLFVAKVLYLPTDAWTFSATAWIDWYTSGDDAKGAGPELTQAYVTTGRRFESGSALRATYSHIAFAQVDRNEFLPVTNDQLADDHSDRASLYGRQSLGHSIGLFGQAGFWSDEDENGGDGEAGFDVRDFVVDGLRAEAAGFGTAGRYSTTIGWRASLDAQSSRGLWRAAYQFTLNDIDGFQSDNDSIPQHRVRASFETHGDSGWSFSSYADVLLFDTETAVIAGLFLQRSF